MGSWSTYTLFALLVVLPTSIQCLTMSSGLGSSYGYPPTMPGYTGPTGYPSWSYPTAAGYTGPISWPSWYTGPTSFPSWYTGYTTPTYHTGYYTGPISWPSWYTGYTTTPTGYYTGPTSLPSWYTGYTTPPYHTGYYTGPTSLPSWYTGYTTPPYNTGYYTGPTSWPSWYTGYTTPPYNTSYYTGPTSLPSWYTSTTGYTTTPTGYYTGPTSLPSWYTSTTDWTTSISPTPTTSTDWDWTVTSSSSSPYYGWWTTTTTYTSPTTPSPPTTPQIGTGDYTDDVNIVSIVESVNGQPKAAIKCNFTIDAGFSYDIALADADGIIRYEADMSPEQASLFSVLVSELFENGGSLDYHYSCCVTAYNNTDVVGPSCSYPARAVSFPTMAYAYRSTGGDLYADINLPFTCGSGSACSLHVMYYDGSEDDDYCDDAQVLFSGTTCGTKITDTAVVSSVFDEQNVGLVISRVKLAYNKGKHNLKNQYTLKLALKAYGDAEEFWNVVFSDPITLYVIEDYAFYSGIACYIENDPWVYTFDGQFYYLEPVITTPDYFTAYKHTTLPVEVQVKVESCGMWGAACSCGVMVRAGTSMFIADYCENQFIKSQSGDNIKYEMINAFKGKLTVPHGLIVEYSLVPRGTVDFIMMNIKILATPSDVNQTVGLCGNLNGYWWDDVYGYSYWEAPTDFLIDYRVTDSSDRIDQIDLDTMVVSDYVEEDERCVCFTPSDSSPKCSIKKSKTCKKADELSDTPSFDDFDSRKRRSLRRQGSLHISANTELVEAINEEFKYRSNFQSRQKRTAVPVSKRKKRDYSGVDQAVIDACDNNMNANCGSLLDNAFVQVNVNVSFRRDNCIGDSMIVPSLASNWSNIACDQVLDNLLGVIEIAEEVMTNEEIESLDGNLCSNNCNGNGVCDFKTCICNAGFGHPDCSLDVSLPPTIQGITGDGQCDLSERTCNYIGLVMNNVVDGAFCSFHHFGVTATAEVIELGQTSVVGIVISMFEIYCPVPTSNSRRRRSTSSSSGSNFVADYYNVSVSNDGSSYSTSDPVVVFDSTCVSYNGTTNEVTLDPEYCIIENLCYGNFSTQNGANCTYCNTSNNLFDWSIYDGYCYINGVCYEDEEKDGCNYCDAYSKPTSWSSDTKSGDCSPSEDEGLAVYIIVIIVLAILLAVVGVVLAVYCFKKHKGKNSLRLNRVHGLFDHQVKQKFKLRPDDGKEAWAVKVESPAMKDYVQDPASMEAPTNLYTDRNMDAPPEVMQGTSGSSSPKSN